MTQTTRPAEAVFPIPQEGNPIPIRWDERSAHVRGPVIGTMTNARHRNVLGAHAGPYSIYGALAAAIGQLDPAKKPDLTHTEPTEQVGPYPQWFEPGRIVSLDPWGAMASQVFAHLIRDGYDIRPTIAITKSHLTIPEIFMAMTAGRLKPDGVILKEDGACVVTKAAIDPVWHLPGVAKRFNIEESKLREVLFTQTGGMFPDLATRVDLEVLLPPVGGMTAYVFGDVRKLADPKVELTVRVHDECNGSDVFGSDICTCRPYLMHGVEECVRGAQRGGVGLIVYSRKEGRALGEVTKLLVYNRRKRQPNGDTAAKYFECTESVAGVVDARFQQLMPDVLHWFGISKIDRLVSMSPYKYEAIVGSGIKVLERVKIPDHLVPADAKVEIEAKISANYYGGEDPKVVDLNAVRGRDLKG